MSLGHSARLVIKRIKRSRSLDWLRPDHLERSSIRQGIVEVAPLARGRLLDVGCANRPYQQLFNSGVTEYIGLEHPKAGGEQGDLLPYVWGDGVKLPFLDESFDTVFSTQTLEHLANPFEAFREMARVLRPGGILLLTAPQTWPEHQAPFDYFRFTRYGLAELCRDAEFEVMSIRPRGGAYIVVSTLLSTRVFCRALCWGRWVAHTCRLVCAVIQAVGAVLDRVDAAKTSTLGYVLVARRSERRIAA